MGGFRLLDDQGSGESQRAPMLPDSERRFCASGGSLPGKMMRALLGRGFARGGFRKCLLVGLGRASLTVNEANCRHEIDQIGCGGAGSFEDVQFGGIEDLRDIDFNVGFGGLQFYSRHS